MTILEDIKDRLDIVEVIGRRVELKPAGSNLRGVCPFHSEKTPSFFVFPSSNRWKCFGCGESGDAIDFITRESGQTLKEALPDLARLAGVDLRPLSAEETRAIARMREKETVFATACEFFHAQMGKYNGDENHFEEPGAGLIYARDRGWTDETIRAEGLGYFGEAWDGLRAALLARNVDLQCPAAVALVGYRGDVATWAKAQGVDADARFVEHGKIPAMPPQMLIYPHVLRGRVIYLAGRLLPGHGDRPKSWNPRRELVGDRQPFFNHLWGLRKFDGQDITRTVIVEGQGCAVTLAQWGVPAMALAGTN